jgi:hypothetical protein
MVQHFAIFGVDSTSLFIVCTESRGSLEQPGSSSSVARDSNVLYLKSQALRPCVCVVVFKQTQQ